MLAEEVVGLEAGHLRHVQSSGHPLRRRIGRYEDEPPAAGLLLQLGYERIVPLLYARDRQQGRGHEERPLQAAFPDMPAHVLPPDRRRKLRRPLDPESRLFRVHVSNAAQVHMCIEYPVGDEIPKLSRSQSIRIFPCPFTSHLQRLRLSYSALLLAQPVLLTTMLEHCPAAGDISGTGPVLSG